MKAILPTSPLAGFFLVALMVPLNVVVPLTHSSAISQTQATDEEIYPQVLRIAEQARLALKEERKTEAANLNQAALKLSPKDHITKAAIYNALGNVFARETYYQLAISHYEEGLKVLSGSQKPDFEAITEALRQIAYSPKGIGGFRGYDSPDLEIIDISDLEALRKRSTASQELSATLLINDGNMYLVQYQNPHAEGLYKRALQIIGTASLDRLRRSTYSNLAWSVIQQGRTVEANELLTTALKDVPASTPPVELRRLLLAVAVKLRMEKKYSDAILRLEQVLPLYQSTENSWEISRATTHLAAAYLAIGNPASAKALLAPIVSNPSQNCLGILGLENLRDCLDSETKRYLHATFAQANWRLGHLETALDHFKIYLEQIDKISSDLITEEGALSVRETQKEVLDDYVRTAFALAKKAKSYDVAHETMGRIRAHSLSILIKARFSGDDPSPGQMSAEFLFGGQLAGDKDSEQNKLPATIIYRDSQLNELISVSNAPEAYFGPINVLRLPKVI